MCCCSDDEWIRRRHQFRSLFFSTFSAERPRSWRCRTHAWDSRRATTSTLKGHLCNRLCRQPPQFLQLSPKCENFNNKGTKVEVLDNDGADFPVNRRWKIGTAKRAVLRNFLSVSEEWLHERVIGWVAFTFSRYETQKLSRPLNTRLLRKYEGCTRKAFTKSLRLVSDLPEVFTCYKNRNFSARSLGAQSGSRQSSIDVIGALDLFDGRVLLPSSEKFACMLLIRLDLASYPAIRCQQPAMYAYIENRRHHKWQFVFRFIKYQYTPGKTGDIWAMQLTQCLCRIVMSPQVQWHWWSPGWSYPRTVPANLFSSWCPGLAIASWILHEVGRACPAPPGGH